MPPYSAIQSLLLQMRISSPVLKVILLVFQIRVWVYTLYPYSPNSWSFNWEIHINVRLSSWYHASVMSYIFLMTACMMKLRIDWTFGDLVAIRSRFFILTVRCLSRWRLKVRRTKILPWCVFVRASSMIWGERQTRCYTIDYWTYDSLTMFRAPLCLSSGAGDCRDIYSMWHITLVMVGCRCGVWV